MRTWGCRGWGHGDMKMERVGMWGPEGGEVGDVGTWGWRGWGHGVQKLGTWGHEGEKVGDVGT